MEQRYQEFLLSDEKEHIQLERVCAMLVNTYWANKRGRETIERSIKNSLCIGVYCNGEQIGFARCVTDEATMFWLADVIVDERFRGRGIGKAIADFAVHHERLRGLTGLLATRDAQGLYERFGFAPVDGRMVMRRAPEAAQTEPAGHA